MEKMMSLLGIAVFVLLAWILSVDRKNIQWKPVLWGVGLQLIIAVVVLHPTMQQFFFDGINRSVLRLLSFSEEAAHFAFGSMEPHEVTKLSATGEMETTVTVGKVTPSMKNIAFWIVLPTIIFFSSLMSLLYQIGVMQRIVWGVAWVMQRTMGTTGPESLSAAANIFVGQTEAPLVVKPYIDKMHASELHAIMTGGFATVAGGVMAAYVGFLSGSIPTIAGHLVAASIMSAPAALALSKVIFPLPKDHLSESSELTYSVDKPYGNVIEAAAMGAAEGMKLALNVLAMLIAFVGLIAMINFFVGWISIGGEPLTLQQLLGWFFAPLSFCMGIPWSESQIVGTLLGEKIVLTEFIAYMHLGEILVNSELSERSGIIASYALCGFANFASIGIQIGGIGSIAPDRIAELSSLGFRAMIAGTLAACMTGTIAGVII